MIEPRWVLDGVLSKDVAGVWDKVWPITRRAVERFDCPNKFTEDDIAENLNAGKMQLWAIDDVLKNRLAAVAITSIISDKRFPGEVVFEVPFVAGYGMKYWIGDLFRVLKAYALSHGCKIMLGYGRVGWTKVVGFDEIGVNEDGIRIMARRLDEEH